MTPPYAKDGGFVEHPGFLVDAVDTVGAGDSFLATLLDKLLAGGVTSTSAPFTHFYTRHTCICLPGSQAVRR